jgi:hypothetical protein
VPSSLLPPVVLSPASPDGSPLSSELLAPPVPPLPTVLCAPPVPLLLPPVLLSLTVALTMPEQVQVPVLPSQVQE